MSSRAAAADAAGASPKRTRLAAPERRAAILDCACRVFAEGSFRGTTTSEIAGAAGVTEPILYRHFPSKKALYLACFDEVWVQVRALWDAAVAAEPDPARWARSMAIAYRNSGGLRDVISSLWLQALAEANEDPEIRAFMRRHMAEVHAYVAAVYRRAQEAGGFVSDRDPDAEAWLSLAVGLLRASDDCLGGLVGDGFAEIDAARFEWLTGTKL